MTRRTSLGSIFAAIAVTGFTFGCQLSCGGKDKKAPTLTPPDSVVTAVPAPKKVVADKDIPEGLDFDLSASKGGGAGAYVRPKLAPTTKIADADARVLLGRVPNIKSDPKDKATFRLRPASQPAPRTGKTIKTQFPPAPGTGGPPPTTTPNTAGLAVLRFAPEGAVPLAPHLSVTFSKPMIAVSSHADTTAAGVPVKLSPQPKGMWRWVGTRTLLFDPDVRFPQATAYRVAIAAGTKSANGDVLAAAKTWTFATPAPRVKVWWPRSGPQPREPGMFLLFDQKIDPAKVLATVRLEVRGKPASVRAMTAKEIESDKDVKRQVAAAKKAENADRWIAFKPATPLPLDSPISIVVGPGTPSEEGPLTTTKKQSSTFRTYAPLVVERARCGYGSRCPPGTAWTFRFNNPLDQDAFDETTVAISPALAGRRLDAQHRYLYVRGRSKSMTSYTVILPATLKDKFGQTLGKPYEKTFNVGTANPRMWGPTGFVVRDPASKKPTLDVFSINYGKLVVKAYRVKPSDWDAFRLYQRKQHNKKPPAVPGTLVIDETIAIKKSTGDMVETSIDLSPIMKGGLGNAVVIVEPRPWTKRWRAPRMVTWVQSTNIALDAFVDHGELIAWANRLSDGAPLANVDLELTYAGTRGRTSAKGTATLPLPERTKKNSRGPGMLVARSGKDMAFLPQGTYSWGSYNGWFKRNVTDQLRWYVFDDRRMYKPGEEVHLKGWMRIVGVAEGGDIGPLGGAVERITYQVVGPRGNKLLSGKSRVSAIGGFDFKFKLPGTPNLGWARVQINAVGKGRVNSSSRRYSHRFQIQEFRRPEFEVTASATDGPHLVGDSADVTVKARYYAGGALPGAQTNWWVRSMPANFTPPNQDKYVFGQWTPWWSWRGSGNQGGKTISKSLSGKTDAVGNHTISLEFLSVKPPRTMAIVAQATVRDVNRQGWTASKRLLVHPANVYVGLKTKRWFYNKGKPIKIDAIAVDLDGKNLTGIDVSVRAARMQWRFKKGKYATEEVDEQMCRATSKADPIKCEFKTVEGGTYKIVATVVDKKGRTNTTQMTIWVSGGETPPARKVEQEKVTLIPDKKEYKRGDTAEILVQAPFYPAEVLLTLRRSGVVSSRRFRMDKSTTTLKIPIIDAYVPNVYVQVDLVGASTRTGPDGAPDPKLPKRPAYARGSLNLPVPPVERTLKVTVTPAAKRVGPGATTSLALRVTDHTGAPLAGAELAVVIVDESVLALSGGYRIPDPLAVFYRQRYGGVADHHLRQNVKLARPELDALAAAGGGGGRGNGYGRGRRSRDDDGSDKEDDMAADSAAPPPPAASPSPTTALAEGKMGKAVSRKRTGRYAAKAKMPRKAGGGSAPQPAIALRTNFDALAVFAPEVTTDASGRATVKVKMPDNLTRYRVMVAAVYREKQFGKGEAAITARKPLMVRPSPPRFLNFGDTFELPIVVQNQTDKKMSVRLAVRSTNATITAGQGRLVQVPANDRVEVRFPAAAELPGTARFQVAASAGTFSDAANMAMPVYTPATTEAFATYGVIDRGATRQPIAMPGSVVEQFGGLQVSTSSTQLQALTDAYLYLVEYPFECSEQLASRVMAVAALRDVLSAFKAKGLPPPKQVKAAVQRDIEKIWNRQSWDGGFGFWRRGRDTWPYLSIHVAHALVRAKAKGFVVRPEMLRRSKRYLKRIERHIPYWYGPEVRRTLIAYALYVRKQMGDRDSKRARTLLREAKGIKSRSMEAVGWILGTLTGDRKSRSELRLIRRHLGNKAVEDAGKAHFVTNYSDGAYLLLHSSRRVDGIVLESLIADQPKSTLIPKLVRGLLAHRKRGRWGNTQENAFVLLALDRYFNVFEKVRPNFVASIWLGDQFAGKHTFRGRTTERKQIDVPMSYIAKVKQADLVISKKGRGRLYYRVGMTYAPSSLKLAPADHGFAVQRRYEGVDNKADAVRLADGTWKLKSGARIRVRLTMVAESRRYHVALVDKLPAGLEPMNPSLAVTGALPMNAGASRNRSGRGRYWWWSRTWYEHQNMRDERVEAFTSLLWEGVHEYSYVTRATTPGRYVVPPAKAEEMYSPETFGRSGSDRVVIQ